MVQKVPRSSVANPINAAFCPFFGNTGRLAAWALALIWASTGWARVSSRLRLDSSCACKFSSSVRLALALASNWRSLASSGALSTTRVLISSRLFLIRILAALRHFGFLLETVDELRDFGRQLLLQPGEIGIELTHARMTRQKRC